MDGSDFHICLCHLLLVLRETFKKFVLHQAKVNICAVLTHLPLLVI